MIGQWPADEFLGKNADRVARSDAVEYSPRPGQRNDRVTLAALRERTQEPFVNAGALPLSFLAHPAAEDDLGVMLREICADQAFGGYGPSQNPSCAAPQLSAAPWRSVYADRRYGVPDDDLAQVTWWNKSVLSYFPGRAISAEAFVERSPLSTATACRLSLLGRPNPRW
jgi:hypothetical protein